MRILIPNKMHSTKTIILLLLKKNEDHLFYKKLNKSFKTKSNQDQMIRMKF